jgi:hypothetical protein
MVRCRLPLMSKALFGGTLLLHNLTAPSGVTTPPSMTFKIIYCYLGCFCAKTRTPPPIDSIHYTSKLIWFPCRSSHPTGLQGCRNPCGEAPILATPILWLSMDTIVTIGSREERRMRLAREPGAGSGKKESREQGLS